MGSLPKIVFVMGVVAAVVAVTLLLTVMMPTIKTFTDFAANDTTTGNYAGYHEAAAAAPIWLYAVPFLVGGIMILVRLRRPE